MNATLESGAIQIPLDRPVEVGRFFFAGSGGSCRVIIEPHKDERNIDGFENVSELCGPGSMEPSDRGYDFWGGSRWFPTPKECLGALDEWIARSALEEKHALDLKAGG